MRDIKVKVHPSKSNLKKEDQLAWKIAEIASDKAQLDKEEYKIGNIDQLLKKLAEQYTPMYFSSVLSSPVPWGAHCHHSNELRKRACDLIREGKVDKVFITAKSAQGRKIVETYELKQVSGDTNTLVIGRDLYDYIGHLRLITKVEAADLEAQKDTYVGTCVGARLGLRKFAEIKGNDLEDLATTKISENLFSDLAQNIMPTCYLDFPTVKVNDSADLLSL